jgi:adenylosuccinate synthase
VSGLGVSPSKIGNITGIFKAYCTRVGSGPFPTELNNELGQDIRRVGNGIWLYHSRERRTGWLNLPLLQYSCMLNGVTELNIMKIDVLSHLKEIEVCVGYLVDGELTTQIPFDLDSEIIPVYKTLKGWMKDISTLKYYHHLPIECREYISFIENRIKFQLLKYQLVQIEIKQLKNNFVSL